MSRVVWTKDEKRVVEAGLVDAFLKYATMGRVEALRIAQQQLPMERRGKITHQRAFAHKAMIERAMHIAKHSRTTKPAAPPTPPPVIEPPTIGALFEQLIERITDQVYERVNARLRKDFGQEAERQFDREFAKHNVDLRRAMVDSPVVKPRRPRCLIIGLLPAQAQTVEMDFRGCNVDLVFLTADEAKSRDWPGADHVFLMTKFVSHSVQNKLYTVTMNRSLVNGGVSDLVLQCIARLECYEKAAA